MHPNTQPNLEAEKSTFMDHRKSSHELNPTTYTEGINPVHMAFGGQSHPSTRSVSLIRGEICT